VRAGVRARSRCGGSGSRGRAPCRGAVGRRRCVVGGGGGGRTLRCVLDVSAGAGTAGLFGRGMGRAAWRGGAGRWGGPVRGSAPRTGPKAGKGSPAHPARLFSVGQPSPWRGAGPEDQLVGRGQDEISVRIRHGRQLPGQMVNGLVSVPVHGPNGCAFGSTNALAGSGALPANSPCSMKSTSPDGVV